MKRLAELALALYPFAYRQRYGEEMRALLDDTEVDGRAVLDLGRGALVAHMRPAVRAIDAENRLRLSAKGILVCWVLFAAAGLGFYKTVEGTTFTALGDVHPAVSGLYLAIQVIALSPQLQSSSAPPRWSSPAKGSAGPVVAACCDSPSPSASW
jgi:hypothetical protein